jgi:hypothetical protein
MNNVDMWHLCVTNTYSNADGHCLVSMVCSCTQKPNKSSSFDVACALNYVINQS